mmetsp:Transcript_33976/g.62180  ORF Transcript_33976/g.62180 Transcript_33976/m.62180 type:complete len:234 (+) Transcript_33976:61-762(+)
MATATYDVGGTIKKVLENVVRSKPDTLLCTLLDDLGKESKEGAIFIDRSADLFDPILDWYRHGFMWLPPGVGMERMRQECAYYALPDDVEIRVEAPGDAAQAFASWHEEATRALANEVKEARAAYDKATQTLAAKVLYQHILERVGNTSSKHVAAGLLLNGVPEPNIVSDVNKYGSKGSEFPALKLEPEWWPDVRRIVHERGLQDGLDCPLTAYNSSASRVKLLKRKRDDTQS